MEYPRTKREQKLNHERLLKHKAFDFLCVGYFAVKKSELHERISSHEMRVKTRAAQNICKKYGI
jgi:hypothetical protein